MQAYLKNDHNFAAAGFSSESLLDFVCNCIVIVLCNAWKPVVSCHWNKQTWLEFKLVKNEWIRIASCVTLCGHNCYTHESLMFLIRNSFFQVILDMTNVALSSSVTFGPIFTTPLVFFSPFFAELPHRTNTIVPDNSWDSTKYVFVSFSEYHDFFFLNTKSISCVSTSL